MIISIDAEKVSDKIQHPFRIKTLKKIYKSNVARSDKSHYDKIAANKILNGETLKVFLLKSGTQRYHNQHSCLM